MAEKSRAPAGAYVEVGTNEIDEGKFVALLDSALRKAFRDFLDYEKTTGDSKAKVIITPKITLQRMKGSEELIDIAYTIPVKVPTAIRSTVAKERGGKMLAQPAGTNDDSPDQQLFYDARGAIIHDPITNQPIIPDVAGRIPAHG